MKVIVDNRDEYNDVMGDYYNLGKYNNDSETEIFFQGYNTTRNDELKKKYAQYKKRVYLNLESPTGIIATKTNLDEQKYFTHIYTLCPYTKDWWVGRLDAEVSVIPFPISLDTFSKINEKKEYDVIYMGTIMYQAHYDIINAMRKYKYVFTSLFNYSAPYTPTHLNVDSMEKWRLLSKSKICITINQAPFGQDRMKNITSYEGWETNKALNRVRDGLVPQIKSRITEAMGLKTLNLVKRDEWNVIEHWFKPNVHFIYWDDTINI